MSTVNEENWYTIFNHVVFNQVNMPKFRIWISILRVSTVLSSIISWSQSATHPKISSSVQAVGIIIFQIVSTPISCYYIWKTGEWMEPFVPLYMHRNVSGRRMVKSNQGRLGLVPKDAAVGDEIFMLQGHAIPLVLRKSEYRNKYILVGECMLHGMMGKSADLFGNLQVVLLV